MQVIIKIKIILGQEVFFKEENIQSNFYSTTFNLNFLAKGLYFFDAIVDGERTVKKVVKE